MSIPTRDEVSKTINDKLATDPAFREALLADPRAALSDATGVQIPDFVTVTVHEESLTDVHLVIPAAAGDEIAEEDLELVAGGGVCWENCSCSTSPGWSILPGTMDGTATQGDKNAHPHPRRTRHHHPRVA